MTTDPPRQNAKADAPNTKRNRKHKAKTVKESQTAKPKHIHQREREETTKSKRKRTFPHATLSLMKFGSAGTAFAWIFRVYSRKMYATSRGFVERMMS